MELTGTIIAVLPAQSGVSARTGNIWMTQEYVLEVPGQYPKKCLFRIFGEERIRQFNIQQGDHVKVMFDIDARESNGRWYNKISVYNINHVVQSKQHTPNASVPPSPPLFPTEKPNDGADDLPF